MPMHPFASRMRSPRHSRRANGAEHTHAPPPNMREIVIFMVITIVLAGVACASARETRESGAIEYSMNLQKHQTPVMSILNSKGSGYTPCNRTFNPGWIEPSAATGGKGALLLRVSECPASFGGSNDHIMMAMCDADGTCGDLLPDMFPFEESAQDPRTYFDAETGWYYLFYYAAGSGLDTVYLRKTKTPLNATSWQRVGGPLPWHRNGCVTPPLANGSHYVMYGETGPLPALGVAVASPDFSSIETVDADFLKPDPSVAGGEVVIEASTPVVKLPTGDYLHFYSAGTPGWVPNGNYTAGFVILDRDDPTKVIQRGTHHTLIASLPFEGVPPLHGYPVQRYRTTFVTSIRPIDVSGSSEWTYRLWWGAADANVATGVLTVKAQQSAPASAHDVASFPWFNMSLPIPQRVSALVAAMNTSEKLSQLIKEEVAIPRLGLPAYSTWCEAAHGVAGAGLATVFPASIARAAAFSVADEWAAAQATSQEARAKYEHAAAASPSGSTGDGQAVSLYAPVVNIPRDGRWGRTQETYGEDPYLSGELGTAFVTGVQVNKSTPQLLQASAMVKHFVAYNLESNFVSGGTNGNFRLQFDANVSLADLRQTYAPAFEALIRDGGAASAMCSYNAIDGIPMCANPLLKSLLRGEFGFNGTLFSDGGAVSDITTQHHYTPDKATAAAAALKAGVDLNSGGKNSDFGYLHLNEALQRGLITVSDVDTALTRVLTLKMRLALYDKKEMVGFRNLPMSVVDSAEHRQLARSYATKGIVLLKNTAGTVPDVFGSARSVAVIGPNANRTAAVLSNYAGCRDPFDGPITAACKLLTPLDGIVAAAPESVSVTFTAGSDLNATLPGGVAAAATAASKADVAVLVLGLSTSGVGNDVVIEAEAHDRVTLGLPAPQENLLRSVCKAVQESQSGTEVILVLMNGGPVSVPWAASSPCVGAIVEAWYGGEEAGSALADVLFGAKAPSGRLPITIPTGDAQLPADYYNLSLAAPPGRTYRYLEDDPLFAFGFGMRHPKTDVQYSGLRVSSPASAGINISVTVANVAASGPCTDEVVQLYVSLAIWSRFDGESAVPLRELKGFRRVEALCPNAGAREVSFNLVPDKDLRLVDVDGAYGVVHGTYDVWVGGRGPGSPGTGVDVQQPGTPQEPLHASFSI